MSQSMCVYIKVMVFLRFNIFQNNIPTMSFELMAAILCND